MKNRFGFQNLAILTVILCGFLADPVRSDSLRFADFNVNSIGASGGTGYDALADVINRVCPSVIVMQELVYTGDITNLNSLATDTGFSYYQHSEISGTMSGNLMTGCMSDFPFVSTTSWSSADISGDLSANDISRDVFEMRVQLPSSEILGVITVHLKATEAGDTDDFRRQIEVIRLCQVIDIYMDDHPSDLLIVAGDFNEDVGDAPYGVGPWYNLPGDLPGTFELGNDLTGIFPLAYDPFQPLLDRGLIMMDATWEDSATNHVTRPVSYRRLDYVFTSPELTVSGDEVYYSTQDNGIDDSPAGNWLSKCGSILPAGTSAEASDHLPVFGDIVYVADTPTPVPSALPGETLLITEVLYDPIPTPDTDAEYIEIYNCGGETLDISEYIITDEEAYPIPSEGAVMFPPGSSIGAGTTVVVANKGDVFYTMKGFYPDYQIVSSTAPVPLMTPIAGFGSIQLNNTEDEVGLIDPSGTVIDSCEWGTSAAVWAIARHQDVSPGNSLERCPPCIDTGDCGADFISHSNDGDPGNVCAEATATPSRTPTGTASYTPTRTPTRTPTSTPSGSPTSFPTNTPTQTVTAGATSTPILTPTMQPTATPVQSAIPSATPTWSPLPVPSSTPAGVSIVLVTVTVLLGLSNRRKNRRNQP